MLLLGRLPVGLLHHRLLRRRLLRLLEMRLLREWRLLRRLLLWNRLRLELLRIWIVVGHWILFSSLATMPVTPSYPHEQSLGGIHCMHTPKSRSSCR